jgi:hypothetical protein
MNNSFKDMMAQADSALESIRAGACGCHRCINERGQMAMHMVVCPTCGNKRCPKASDHNLACTDSNESGQAGSAYA